MRDLLAPPGVFLHIVVHDFLCVFYIFHTHYPFCWSERSACAALRRCTRTKCPLFLGLFFFLLSFFSVPYTFLPEGVVLKVIHPSIQYLGRHPEFPILPFGSSSKTPVLGGFLNFIVIKGCPMRHCNEDTSIPLPL